MAFPIKCGDCNKSFSISDEVYNRKVRGKLVTIKCKSCGSAIRVDGTKPVASSQPAPATSKEEIKPRSAQPPAATPATPAAASAPEAKPLGRKPDLGAPAGPATASPARPAAKPLGKGLISSPTKPQVTRGPLASEKQAARGEKSSPFAASASKGGLTPKPKSIQAAAPAPKPPTTAAASRPNAPAPLPSPQDNILWAVDYGESEHRELTTAEIEQEIKEGNIDGQTLVWHDNMPDWLAILDVKELRGFVESSVKKDTDGPSAKPALPKSKPGNAGLSKELPSAPKAAPPPPLGPLSSKSPAPTPPTPATGGPPPPPTKKPKPSAVEDEVVTSARLIDGAAPTDPFADLRSAPNAPGAPSPGTPPSSSSGSPLSASQANPVPPAAPGGFPVAGMASPPALPNTAGAPQGLPPASAATPPALPGAAAPGLGPTSATSAPALPTAAQPAAALPMQLGSPGLTDDIDWPQARSKKPLVFAALGVLGLALLMWLILGSSDADPPAPAPQTQAASPVEPRAEPTPPAAPEPEPTAAPADEADDSSGQPASTAKDGDFADLFEQSAKRSD